MIGGVVACVISVLVVSACGDPSALEDPIVSDTTGFGGEDGGSGDPDLERNKSIDNPTRVDTNIDAELIDVERWPVVLSAQATQVDGGIWRFDVTLSSPYDTPDRYADGWRVLDVGGQELGMRVLTHDHASEQPFTRSLDGVAVAPTVSTVFIEGRDQANGWSGQRFEVSLIR